MDPKIIGKETAALVRLGHRVRFELVPLGRRNVGEAQYTYVVGMVSFTSNTDAITSGGHWCPRIRGYYNEAVGKCPHGCPLRIFKGFDFEAWKGSK